jgi:hypothetical protein
MRSVLHPLFWILFFSGDESGLWLVFSTPRVCAEYVASRQLIRGQIISEGKRENISADPAEILSVWST